MVITVVLMSTRSFVSFCSCQMYFFNYEGMYRALYALKDIFVKLLPAVNPACSAAIIWFGLEPGQDDFHYDFTRMVDETDGSVVLAEL